MTETISISSKKVRSECDQYGNIRYKTSQISPSSFIGKTKKIMGIEECFHRKLYFLSPEKRLFLIIN